MRICRQCGEKKPLDEFHRNKNKPRGRHIVCKVCAIENTRRWRNANSGTNKILHHKPWTPEDITQLIALRRLKRTYLEIAEAMDRTEKSIENAIVYFGLQQRKQKRGVHTATILNTARKHGPERTAEILGISRRTVYKRLTRCKTYPTHPTRGRRGKEEAQATA